MIRNKRNWTVCQFQNGGQRHRKCCDATYTVLSVRDMQPDHEPDRWYDQIKTYTNTSITQRTAAFTSQIPLKKNQNQGIQSGQNYTVQKTGMQERHMTDKARMEREREREPPGTAASTCAPKPDITHPLTWAAPSPLLPLRQPCFRPPSLPKARSPTAHGSPSAWPRGHPQQRAQKDGVAGPSQRPQLHRGDRGRCWLCLGLSLSQACEEMATTKTEKKKEKKKTAGWCHGVSPWLACLKFSSSKPVEVGQCSFTIAPKRK